MKNLLLLLCLSSFLSLSAQKLPDIQNTGLRAPSGVRVDGKVAEWKDTYEAFNKRTSLSYSIANDDKYIYLLVKAEEMSAINKIMAGGITFSINTKGKRNEKEAYSITYPFIPRNSPSGTRAGGGMNRGGVNVGGASQMSRPTGPSPQRDSLQQVQHRTRLASVKEIPLKGFSQIPDSLISIYNEYGIKVAGSIQEGVFFCEMAIPLSIMELSPGDTSELMYQLKLNGLSMGSGNGGQIIVLGGQGRLGGGNIDFQDLSSPTDFWGKYPFIKP